MADGSFESALEATQKRDAEVSANAKPQPKSDKQQRVDELLVKLPNIGVREALEQISRLDPVIWTMYHRRLKGMGMTFDVARHLTQTALDKWAKDHNATQREYKWHHETMQQRHRPWQVEPLRDEHPHKVYKKGRQIGITELSLTEAICFLDQNENTNLIYCFPRDKQLETLNTTRITPAFAESARMRALLSGTNNVTMKRINKSHMILRSAWDAGLGEGVNADVVVFDEKDRMKPGIEVAFRESMSSSPFRWVREVSTPTLPNRGVDEKYQLSDQRQWFVKCSKCGTKQPINEHSIVQMMPLPMVLPKELPHNAFAYICKRRPKCEGTLDRMNGEWVAKRPQIKRIRGYHMPQMIAIWLSATDIMQKRVDYKFIQLWINYVLGEVSLGESMLLTERDFQMATAGHRLVTQRSDDWVYVSVGIDWGHKNWITVTGLNTNGRVYVLNAHMFEDDRKEPLSSVRQIDQWIEPFKPDIIIADDGYGKDRNAYLLRKYGEGKFFACRYNQAEKGGQTFTPSWQPARNQVLCDRTMALKNLCRLIKDREIGFPNQEHEIIQALVEHLKGLTPMLEEDEESKEIIEVVRSTSDDHLAHGLFYAQLGMDYLRKTNHFNFDFMA
jgi:hypothetical protein